MSTLLVPLADVKDWLNIPQATTTYDVRLTLLISAITTVIENTMGDVVPHSRVDTFDRNTPYYGEGYWWGYPTWNGLGGVGPLSTQLPLIYHPIISVESITINGTVVDPTTYIVDLPSAVIKLLTAPWAGTVIVSYTSGRTTVYDSVIMAAKLIVQDLWDPELPLLAVENDELASGQQELISRRARALIWPTVKFA